jgi:hypothetical protein
MKFRDKEKARYKSIKPILFSPEAQRDGNYRRIPRSFCLDDEHSEENLFADIQKSAIDYFKQRRIGWHYGLAEGQKPSNHLCCSQCCCLNFLFPMTRRPDLLMIVFKKYYSDLIEPLTIDKDNPLADGSFPYIGFEWIGVEDYLGETHRKGMNRTRGANYTSVDFVLRFRRKDGKIQIVLGEWKYTEEYGESDKGIEVRRQNYHQAFHRKGGIFKRQDAELYNALFFDPFYQLMRLQLLAQEMEFNKEMDADVVSVLYISPAENTELREGVTSPYLRKTYPKEDVFEIWKGLVPEDRFTSISTENLLSTITESCSNTYTNWVDYLNTRYGWDKASCP